MVYIQALILNYLTYIIYLYIFRNSSRGCGYVENAGDWLENPICGLSSSTPLAIGCWLAKRTCFLSNGGLGMVCEIVDRKKRFLKINHSN